MTTVAKLEAILSADTGNFDRAMRKSDGTMSSLAKTAGKAGLAGAIVGLGVAAKIGFSEFMAAQKVAAQTGAVLKSTGGAANVTAAAVGRLSTSLMKKSGVDDEVIASGQNMLLTFTNVRNEAGKGNDVFAQATKAALDLSVATGKDLTSANVMLGKALNDPAKGLTALTRVGVTFTDGQKTMIKSLVASGDTMGAQKVILSEMTREFGGSAEAIGKTLPGQINIAKETMRNFAGDIVAKVVPAIAEVVNYIKDHWPEIRTTVQEVVAAVRPVIVNAVALFKSVADIVQANWPTISRNLTAVKTVVVDVMKIIGLSLKLVADLLKGDWSAAWVDAKKIVSTTIDAIKTILVNALANVKGAALAIGKGVYNGIKDGITGIGAWVTGAIGGIKDIIAGAAQGVYTAAKGFGGKILSGIGDALSSLGASLATWIKKPINAVIGDINGLIGKINSALEFSVPGIKILGKTVVPGVSFNAPDLPKIPGLAAGGTVKAGVSYLVGERGPEMFTSRAAGMVTPNHQLGGAGITWTGDVVVNGDVTGTELVNKVRDALIQINRRTGGNALGGFA